MLKQTSETLTVVITIDLSWLGKPTFRIVTKKTGAVYLQFRCTGQKGS